MGCFGCSFSTTGSLEGSLHPVIYAPGSSLGCRGDPSVIEPGGAQVGWG